MDSSKVEVKETEKYGKATFAKEFIQKGECIAAFDGKEYEAQSCLDLPEEPADHAIQFAEHKWKDSKGIARYINHSCEPNCGIKDSFKIVALKNIEPGEEITWDYEMTEDSNWRMDCHCGAKTCRKSIGAFRNMPKEKRAHYKGYIAEWLVKKYNLNQ